MTTVALRRPDTFIIARVMPTAQPGQRVADHPAGIPTPIARPQLVARASRPATRPFRSPAWCSMKLQSNRDQDRVHLRDMIDVGLVGRKLMGQLPPDLAARLEPLLAEAGR